MSMHPFKQAILNINQQLTAGALKYFNLGKIRGKPDAIVIIGMGGSGQVGDLIINLANELKIPVPVVVWKDYDLPKLAYKNPLYIFVSFSGNTKETLSGFSAKGGQTPQFKAVVCSGGKLKAQAIKNNVPLAVFSPKNLVPRQATGYMFYGAMNIIKSIFKDVDLPTLKIRAGLLEKKGEKIARELKRKIVLIYSTSKNSHLAYNWKTRLNETAKSLSFSGILPEMSHNEIVPFDNHHQGLIAVFLEDSQDNSRNKKKINLIINLLKNRGVKSLKIDLSGKSQLEKTWNNLILADWVSYYLAKIKKVNPQETKLIDQLKNLMG